MRSMTLSLFAAGAITGIWIGGTSAMQVNNIPGGEEGTPQAVRLICDRFERCYNPRRVPRPRPHYTHRSSEQPAFFGQPHYGFPSGLDQFQQHQARRNMLY